MSTSISGRRDNFRSLQSVFPRKDNTANSTYWNDLITLLLWRFDWINATTIGFAHPLPSCSDEIDSFLPWTHGHSMSPEKKTNFHVPRRNEKRVLSDRVTNVFSTQNLNTIRSFVPPTRPSDHGAQKPCVKYWQDRRHLPRNDKPDSSPIPFLKFATRLKERAMPMDSLLTTRTTSA